MKVINIMVIEILQKRSNFYISLLADNAPEFRGHVISQLKKMLSMKDTFTVPYWPQLNCLCEHMNQTIENIIKCTVRDEQVTRSSNDGLSFYSPDINRIHHQYFGDMEGNKHGCESDRIKTDDSECKHSM